MKDPDTKRLMEIAGVPMDSPKVKKLLEVKKTWENRGDGMSPEKIERLFNTRLVLHIPGSGGDDDRIFIVVNKSKMNYDDPNYLKMYKDSLVGLQKKLKDYSINGEELAMDAAITDSFDTFKNNPYVEFKVVSWQEYVKECEASWARFVDDDEYDVFGPA